MSGTEPKIAVIGPRASGKTCLAVGLYRIAGAGRSGLTVETPDQSTETYLEGVMRTFDSGEWPDATLWEKEEEPRTAEAEASGTTRWKTKAKDIRLDFISANGQSTRIAFKEFAGELVADKEAFLAFANEHFRELDGVVLAVNPGMDAFVGQGSRDAYNQCRKQYRRIIKYLGDRNNGPKPHVALTVTAADRLQGDLKGTPAAKRFSKFVKELERRLRARLFDTKTFRVSITGPLADQGKPQLADGDKINAAEPFLWLVNRITNGPRIAGIIKWIAGIAAGAALLAVLVAGAMAIGRSSSEAVLLEDCKKWLETCQESENTRPKPEMLEKAKWALATLETNAWSEKNVDAAQAMRERYKGEVDRGFRATIGHGIKGFRGGDESNIDDLFGLWTSTFAGDADGCQEIRELKKDWEERKYECRGDTAVRSTNLVQLAGFYPGRAATNEFLSAEYVERRWRERYKKAYETAYDAFLDEVARAAAARKGKPEMDPEDRRTVVQKSAEVQEPFDSEAALKELEARIKKKADPLRMACHQWVDDHVKVTAKRERSELLRQYFKARDGELRRNPFFDEIVRTAVYEQAELWLQEDIAWYEVHGGAPLCDGDKETTGDFITWFDKFSTTCLNLSSDDDTAPDTSSWVYQYARRCKENGKIKDGVLNAFPQTLTITRIDCNMDYHGKFPVAYVQTSFDAFLSATDYTTQGANPVNFPVMDNGTKHALQKKDAQKWMTVWEGSFRHTAGLFSPMTFMLQVTDENSLSPWKKISDLIVSNSICGWEGDWFNGKPWREFECDFQLNRQGSGDDVPKILVRVYGKLEGETPKTLYEQERSLAEPVKAPKETEFKDKR